LRKCDVVVVGTNAIRVAHNNDALELHHLVGHDIGGEIQFSQAFGRERRAVIGEKHVAGQCDVLDIRSDKFVVTVLALRSAPLRVGYLARGIKRDAELAHQIIALGIQGQVDIVEPPLLAGFIGGISQQPPDVTSADTGSHLGNGLGRNGNALAHVTRAEILYFYLGVLEFRRCPGLPAVSIVHARASSKKRQDTQGCYSRHDSHGNSLSRLKPNCDTSPGSIPGKALYLSMLGTAAQETNSELVLLQKRNYRARKIIV